MPNIHVSSCDISVHVHLQVQDSLSVGDEKQRSQELLDEECLDRLATFLSILDEACKQLLSGNIPLPLLHLILSHREPFLDLVEYSSELKDRAFAQHVLETRQQEVNNFRAVKRDVAVVHNFCLKLQTGKYFLLILHVTVYFSFKQAMIYLFPSVKCSTLKNQLKAEENSLSLSDLCDPVTLDQLKQKVKPPFSRKFFAVPDQLLDSVTHIKQLEESRLFVQSCKRIVNKVPLTLDKLPQVLDSAFDELMKTTERLQSGEVLFSEIDKLFGFLDKNYAAIRKEMAILEGFTGIHHWTGGCLEKIEKYHQLDQYHRGAQIMQRVRRNFNLQGNFTMLDQLEKAVGFRMIKYSIHVHVKVYRYLSAMRT